VAVIAASKISADTFFMSLPMGILLFLGLFLVVVVVGINLTSLA
jgi:hypothetical protein